MAAASNIYASGEMSAHDRAGSGQEETDRGVKSVGQKILHDRDLADLLAAGLVNPNRDLDAPQRSSEWSLGYLFAGIAARRVATIIDHAVVVNAVGTFVDQRCRAIRGDVDIKPIDFEVL